MAATPTASATSEETKPPRRSDPARRGPGFLALATHGLAYGPSDELKNHVGLDTTAISSGRVWTLVTDSIRCQNNSSGNGCQTRSTNRPMPTERRTVPNKITGTRRRHHRSLCASRHGRSMTV
jgi:hypothetical protein